MVEYPLSQPQASIIVATHNPPDLSWLSGTLTENGYNVRLHFDGPSALTGAWADPPALFLLDVDLPHPGSYEICRRLTGDERTATIPVIFMIPSAELSQQEHKAKLFVAGGVDYITKPFQVDEVLAKLETQVKLSVLHRQLVAQKTLLQQERVARTALEEELQRSSLLLAEPVGVASAFHPTGSQPPYHEFGDLNLPESTLRLTRLTVEQLPDALYWMDSTARFVDVNGAACRMLGYTRAELLNLSLTDIDPEFVMDEWQAGWQYIKAKGKLTLERIHRTKAGRLIPVEVMNNFIQFGDRELNCSFARDITARKQTEAALYKSEERLRQAIRVSRIGIFDHNHPTGSTYVSAEYRDMRGWGPEEPVTMARTLEQVHPEDQARVEEAIQRACDPTGDGIYDLEYRIMRPDGTTGYLSSRAQTFFEGTGPARHPIRTVGAVLDVTEARQAEEAQARLEAQLHQTQKLETIGQLAGGIAHDFNNLLTPIIGYAELGQADLAPDTKLFINLEQIKTAARRAASLNAQLLAFSRRQVLEVQVVSLNEIITEFQPMLRRLISEDIEVRISLASAPCLVKADRTQMTQILLNLSVNARDAMPNGGTLIIETGNVYLDEAYAQTHLETKPGYYVMLSLSDTGHGMDTKTQEHIFEPFFTTKAQGKGTGLGLATIFGIVKQHRGNIWVYSEPGKGTTFKIYLPQAEQPALPATIVLPETTTTSGTATVLVVEDQAMVRKLTCETLEAYGYTVLEAESPDQALQLASTHEGPVHLLLTDVIMPVMNGRELYDKLTTVRPKLKVLYMSGYTDNVIVHHGVLDEGVNFIQKPFTIQGLVEKVRTALA
ncbi:MAG TPA: response regulator [Anaerolineae bacterium]|nr:response regulator [Anaerolineae bacterium]